MHTTHTYEGTNVHLQPRMWPLKFGFLGVSMIHISIYESRIMWDAFQLALFAHMSTGSCPQTNQTKGKRKRKKNKRGEEKNYESQIMWDDFCMHFDRKFPANKLDQEKRKRKKKKRGAGEKTRGSKLMTIKIPAIIQPILRLIILMTWCCNYNCCHCMPLLFISFIRVFLYFFLSFNTIIVIVIIYYDNKNTSNYTTNITINHSYDMVL